MSKQVEYSYIAILTKPQTEQNEYTFAFISMYSYIAILTKPQTEQNEYTFAFISMYSFIATQIHKMNKTNIKRIQSPMLFLQTLN